MKATIRPAVEADRATILEASEATWEEHRQRQPDAFAENGWEMLVARGHIVAFIDKKGQRVAASENLFVADADGQVVGFILLSWHLRADAGAYHKGSINDIWVHPDWRGKGIAREMVDFAKERAEARGWDDLTAQVWHGAPSSGLFAEAGFAPWSTIWRYGPDQPARLLKARAKGTTPQEDSWWKWAVLATIIACFITIMMTLQ